MNKSGTLITSALLTFGIAAAAMAANSPKATATMAADTQPPGAPTIGPPEDQRAVNTAPPKSAGKPTTSAHKYKHKKKHKPATPAPMTAK
jgi:hypothetical protein